MVIKEYSPGTVDFGSNVTYLELDSAPILHFSVDDIPETIPNKKEIEETFSGWHHTVQILAQDTKPSITVLSMTINGRPAQYSEMEYLCDRMGVSLAKKLYGGPFNLDLLNLIKGRAIICHGEEKILWRPQ